MSPTGSTGAATPPLGHDAIEVATLNELVTWRARHDGDARFITFLADGDRDERTLTHAELDARGRAVAGLLAERGLVPGDRVLIMLDSGLDFIVSFFGVLLGGMIPVPVYPPARLARLEYYLRTLSGILSVARCRAGIADRRLVPLVGPRLESEDLVLVSDRDLATAIDSADPATLPEAYRLLPSSPGFLQFTSGTTQRPRGVLLLQEQIMAQLHGYCAALRTLPNEVVVSWLPLHHDLGLIGKVFASLCGHLHLVLLSPAHFLKDPMSWIRALSRYRGNHTAAPNFAFQLCVRKCPDERLREEKIDLSCVSNAGSGGECVSMAVIESFAEKFAPFGFRREALNPSYGLAENTLVVSTHRHDESIRSVTLSKSALQRNEVSEPADEADALTIPGNGRPLEEITVRIVSPQDGAVRGEREIGEVWVKSPSLASAYFRDGDATAKTFVTNEDGRWLRTGDLGFLADGDVYICGRSKDLMIVRGRNFYPQDLEEIAGAVKGVRTGNVAAFSVEDPDAGEKAVMVCELDGRVARSPEEVRADIVEAINVAFTLQLGDVVFVPRGSVPKTSSGKLQRSLAKDAYLRGALAAFAPPGQLAKLRLQLGLGLTAARHKVFGVPGRKRTESDATASADETAAADDHGGLEALDPRLVEALQRARPDIATDLSPRLRLDALGLDSLQIMELRVAVERLYDAQVPDEEWQATRTLGGVQRLVERCAGKSAHRAGDDADLEPETPMFVRDLLEADAAGDAAPIVPWRRPITAPVAFAILHLVSRIFWGLRVAGTERLPTENHGYILAGNHQSYLDGAWVRNALEAKARARLVTMVWEDAPGFTQWFVRQIEAIPIDIFGNFRGAMQAGLRTLGDERILMIFPEGARTHTGAIDAFRPGVGLLGLLSQRPIVPFRIRGAFEIYPRDRRMPKFFRWRTAQGEHLDLRFGDPIIPPAHEPARTWAQARVLVDEVRRAVEAL